MMKVEAYEKGTSSVCVLNVLEVIPFFLFHTRKRFTHAVTNDRLFSFIRLHGIAFVCVCVTFF
jgi:hypothetical protein